MSKFRSLGILIIAVSAGLAYAEDKGVKEYGVSRGEPITDSFLFLDGKYVKAPYVVERRGLAIYINKTLVNPSPDWPFYDYTVKTDPGDPPKGSSPFDPNPPGGDIRKSYWAKKWRYLHSHFDHDKAKQMMFETYKKNTELKEVSWSDKADMVILTHKSGKTMVMDLSPNSDALGLTEKKKKEMVGAAEKVRLTHEKRISGGVALFTKYRLSYTIPKEQAVDAVEILLSKQSQKEKIAALEQMGLLKPGDRGIKPTWVVKDFQTGPGLKEHLARIKKIRAEEKKNPANTSQPDTPADNGGDPTTETPSSPDTPDSSGTETSPLPPPPPVSSTLPPPLPPSSTPTPPTPPASPPAANNPQPDSTPPASSSRDKGFPVGHVVMAVVALIVVIGVVRFLRQRRFSGT